MKSTIKRGEGIMKLNINLIPKKEPSGLDLTLILSVTLLIAVLCTSYGGYLYYSEQKNIQALDQQIANEQVKLSQARVSLAEREQQITRENYIYYWQELHALLNLMYINPVEHLYDLSSRLPHQAYITGVVYDKEGKIVLDMSFATLGDVSTFMESALESSLIHAINVPFIQAQEELVWNATTNQSERSIRYRTSIELDVLTTSGEGIQ